MLSCSKPFGIAWDVFIEGLLRDAEERGKLALGQGRGKPIAGLDQPHDDNWWLKAYLQRENLALPAGSLDVRREVEAGLKRLRVFHSEAAVRHAVDELNHKIARANATSVSDPPTNLAKLDADEVVAAWKQRRERVAHRARWVDTGPQRL